VWPDNRQAVEVFRRVGSKWVYPAMGGAPLGLRWEAIYPLMDRLGLSPEEWDGLHDDLSVMEQSAIHTLNSNPKPAARP
jgi:hypothetical protein